MKEEVDSMRVESRVDERSFLVGRDRRVHPLVPMKPNPM